MNKVMKSHIVNISAYKFVQLNKLATLKAHFLAKGDALGIKGTILLAEEGINLMLAAEAVKIDAFLAILKQDARFADIHPKMSFSDQLPFERFKVRIKQEIISMGDTSVQPQKETAVHLDAAQFKQWIDEGRDITILDTRNRYEIAHGTFEQAIDLGIDNFRDFPQACRQLAADDTLKHKPLIMFCTGGVRCEKAALPIMRMGFKQVYQLDGGIINYFEQCGGAHYKGNCFVFDERTALNPQLQQVGSVTSE